MNDEKVQRIEIRPNDIGWMGNHTKVIEVTDQVDEKVMNLLSEVLGKPVRGFILAARHSNGIMVAVSGLLEEREIGIMMLQLTEACRANIRAARDKAKLVNQGEKALPK
jgi:uncharacterized lipoprotein YajG